MGGVEEGQPTSDASLTYHCTYYTYHMVLYYIFYISYNICYVKCPAMAPRMLGISRCWQGCPPGSHAPEPSPSVTFAEVPINQGPLMIHICVCIYIYNIRTYMHIYICTYLYLYALYCKKIFNTGLYQINILTSDGRPQQDEPYSSRKLACSPERTAPSRLRPTTAAGASASGRPTRARLGRAVIGCF